jgi:acetyl-CoA carboxylase biotin carboxyl carrier protein
MDLDLEHLKQLLDLVREHELAEFEIEHDGLRVKIRKDSNGASLVAVPPSPPVPTAVVPAAAPPPAAAGSTAASAPSLAPADTDADGEIELAVVKSPIVGTFYRSLEPGSDAFVEIGTTVKKGQVLCIIEAMKLMNEIDSEYDGEVVNIYVENGQPVQYAERLFAIRTR